MNLLIENFLKTQLLNSKIWVFLATTFSVLIMALLGIIAVNYNNVESILKENIGFNLILNDSLEELETQRLIKSISLIDGIKSVTYISKLESAQNLSETLGEEFLSVLPKNPLKNIIEIKYYSDYISDFSIKETIKNYTRYDEIDNVFYDEEIIFLIEKNLKKFGLIFIIIAGIFFLVAFILINSNIRLEIYSKRFVIKTMQLVGATKSFIQKPFIVKNLISSLIACFFGILILVVFIIFTIDRIPEISTLITSNQLIYVLLASVILNLKISLISTWLCVRRYLNLQTDDIYR